MNPGFIQKPYGVKDYLPQAAKIKRNTEDTMLATFEKWGYNEVATPSFEFLETFLLGNSFNLGERIFKFFDRQGRVLALRPDMTTPIARLVASNFKEWPGPIRLCYVSKVFRFEQPRAGRQCEFHQAGAELIGDAELDADAEVIALAVNALKDVGIAGLKVNIGHFGFIEAVLNSIKVDGETRRQIKELLFKKDLVGLEAVADKLPISSAKQDMVKALFSHIGPGSEILNRASCMDLDNDAKQALIELEAVISALYEYEIEPGFVTVDLGLVRGLDYYTGIVFEIYSPHLGYPVCGGGRYDKLIEKFDGPKAATGFAINIDGVLGVLDRQGQCDGSSKLDYLICYDDVSRPLAIKEAMSYRRSGFTAETLAITDVKSIEAFASVRKPCSIIIWRNRKKMIHRP